MCLNDNKNNSGGFILIFIVAVLSSQVTRTEVLYWKVDEPVNFSAENFPVFKFNGGSGDRNNMFYGLPALEYPGLLKVQYIVHGICY